MELISNPNIKTSVGDVKDPTCVENFLDNSDILISTLGHRENDNSLFCDATKNIITSFKNDKSKKYISVYGITLQDSNGRLYIRDKVKTFSLKLSFPYIIKDKHSDIKVSSEKCLGKNIY